MLLDQTQLRTKIVPIYYMQKRLWGCKIQMKQRLFQSSPKKLKNSLHNLELYIITLLIMTAVIYNINNPLAEGGGSRQAQKRAYICCPNFTMTAKQRTQHTANLNIITYI